MTDKIKNIVVSILMASILFSLSLWCWLKPPDDYSESERRILTKFPAFSADALLSGDFMTDFEEYTLDQFPVRDIFRSIKSYTSLSLFNNSDSNGLYKYNGHLSKIEYPLNIPMLENASDKFRTIYDAYLSGSSSNIFFSIIPDKNYYLSQSSGHLRMDYDEFFSVMQRETNYMEYIDITGLLSINDYYCTDSHWKQENITDVAQFLAQSMGTNISGVYEVNTLDTAFYGVYTGQLALSVKPDTIKYLTNDIIENCTVMSFSSGTAEFSSMYDMTEAAGKDPYEMFLSGTEALLVIDNPLAETDKELIIFRDSFGSSIIPLLSEGYRKITVVDIRYIDSSLLNNYIDFSSQDVLFLFSTTILNNSLAFK